MDNTEFKVKIVKGLGMGTGIGDCNWGFGKNLGESNMIKEKVKQPITFRRVSKSIQNSGQ